jgi:hypothetical protein
MDLASEILADFHQLLTEHGVRALWKDMALLVLVSRIRRDQQIDMGGFVDSPELSQPPFPRPPVRPPALSTPLTPKANS